MLKSALGYAQIEKKTETLSDADVMAMIQREAKKRRDSIDEFEKAGRTEMAANEKAELEVLTEYLPKALSSEELESLIREVITEVGATSKKDMGAVMKVAQSKVDGRADGMARRPRGAAVGGARRCAGGRPRRGGAEGHKPPAHLASP